MNALNRFCKVLSIKQIPTSIENTHKVASYCNSAAYTILPVGILSSRAGLFCAPLLGLMLGFSACGYTKLTVNEVREMVVIKKWLATITGRCLEEMQRVTQDIAASVTALAERYERTLGEIEKSASNLEKKVNNHLLKMGFEL